MPQVQIPKKHISSILDFVLVVFNLLVILSWVIGHPILYSDSLPTMSIFTSISLLLMSASRLAETYIETWSRSMSLAMLGVVIGGNLSSVSVQVLVPNLFILAIPNIVPTSIMTSTGLMIFSFYQILVLIRPTIRRLFIIDDILLHLALAPGGVSLLGHVFNNPTYLSASSDPRVGISLLEMAFMGVFAITSICYNPNLFLWKFLKTSIWNRIVFALLFANQYLLPILIGYMVHGNQVNGIGIEFFVLFAGTLATLTFLVMQSATSLKKSLS